MQHRTNLAAASLCLALSACGSTEPETPATTPVCDQRCQDDRAARAIRQALRALFNLALQGDPVGEQDQTSPCPQGGTARITGKATSNAEQGTTEVDLVYELSQCKLLSPGFDGYDLSLDGAVSEKGILPSNNATTALLIKSDALTLKGTVSEPAIAVSETCAVSLDQNGGTVSGKLCDRVTSFSF